MKLTSKMLKRLIREELRGIDLPYEEENFPQYPEASEEFGGSTEDSAAVALTKTPPSATEEPEWVDQSPPEWFLGTQEQWDRDKGILMPQRQYESLRRRKRK